MIIKNVVVYRNADNLNVRSLNADEQKNIIEIINEQQINSTLILLL